MRCGMAARAGAQAADCSETTVAPARHVSGRLDERVLDCVWADSDLLALEFEAIVSANYPTPADRPDRHPPVRRLSVQTGRTPTPHHVGRRGNTPAPTGSRPTRRRAFARERGPPRDDARNSSHRQAVPRSQQRRSFRQTASTGPVAALPPTCHGNRSASHPHPIPEVTFVWQHTATSAPRGAQSSWHADAAPWQRPSSDTATTIRSATVHRNDNQIEGSRRPAGGAPPCTRREGSRVTCPITPA